MLNNKNNVNWKNNNIQFPRLISEIYACHDNLDINALADSMDLETCDIIDIIERAQSEWEKIKKRCCPTQFSNANKRNKCHGVYINLFHGRRGSVEQMDEWGYQGPIFGPFDYIHTTYVADIKLGENCILNTVDDLIYYDEILYGDWSVCTLEMFEKRDYKRIADFDQTKANIVVAIS